MIPQRRNSRTRHLQHFHTLKHDENLLQFTPVPFSTDEDKICIHFVHTGDLTGSALNSKCSSLLYPDLQIVSNPIDFNIPFSFSGKRQPYKRHSSLFNPSCLAESQMFASDRKKRGFFLWSTCKHYCLSQLNSFLNIPDAKLSSTAIAAQAVTGKIICHTACSKQS